MTTAAKQFLIDATRAAKPKRGTKYRNTRCQDVSGRWFDSKLERENHLRIEEMARGKGIRVSRQVSFIVIDGEKPVRMVVDHVVALADGVIELYDTKGRKPTREWINKARAIKASLGLDVRAIGKNLKYIDY